MKKTIVIAAIAALTAFTAGAQNISYVLSSVAEPVKKNAHVITRYENQVFEVADLDKATLNVHRVVTIVDAEGKDQLHFGQYTSKYVGLDEVEIKVYDAFGKMVNKYKKKDMYTQAVGSGLIEEGNYTSFNIPIPSYPATIETKYELKYKGTLFLPSFNIISPGEGVEISSFTAKVPKSFELRYKEKNITLKPEVTEDAKNKTYKWTVTNMAPVEDEEGAVSSEYRFPSIQLAPNKFSFYGYEGDISSWQSFGAWMQQLYKGLDELSEYKKAYFRDLVKNAKDDREKVRLVYEYLQKNFRYVSIQLGIGGFRPFSAEFTDNKKYGDCKALSNYVKAALKAVDIKSHVAIINAQYNGMPADPEFPDDNFNHVILCVPQKNDSIWLECTSSTAEFGVLGSSTENRNALLLTDAGGVLVPTPSSTPEGNRYLLHTTIKLDENGSGATKTTFQTSGRYRQLIEHYLTEKKDDQKEFIVNGLDFKQPDEFELSKQEHAYMHTAVLNMSYEKVPEFVAGSKMFISPRLYKISIGKLPKAEKRKLDFYFYNPFLQTDTTVFQLPAGFTMDALPKDKEMNCPYATYTTKYWYNEEQKAVYSTAQLTLKKHIIPAAGYAEVKKFFDEIQLDDAQRIVIRKL
jgi:hypothetical protein